jgi:hypothetical protein
MFARPLLRGQFKRLLEQRNRALNIVGFLEVETNPTAVRQDVMRLGATSSDNVIPHLSRKGNIHEMVAVDVAQLTFAQTKFRPTKAMRMLRHTWPTQNGFMDFLSRAMDSHKTCAFQFAHRMNLLRRHQTCSKIRAKAAQRGDVRDAALAVGFHDGLALPILLRAVVGRASIGRKQQKRRRTRPSARSRAPTTKIFP